jgi:hypothetical protein
MLFRRKKPSPDPALENEFRRKMGRKIKPSEARWIELADKALSERPQKRKTDGEYTPYKDREAA